MRALFVGLLFALIFSGCQSSSSVIALEAQKISTIKIGMTTDEVKSIMGTEPFLVDDYESRPLRIDKFKSKIGDQVEIYYYRSSVKRRDGVCTDDETTAVIFVKGKVDAITSGDGSRQVLELRVR